MDLWLIHRDRDFILVCEPTGPLTLCWEFEEGATKVKIRGEFTLADLPEDFFFVCLSLLLQPAP